MTKHAVQAARMFDGERLVDGGVLVLLDGGRIAPDADLVRRAPGSGRPTGVRRVSIHQINPRRTR
ncbi:hypothetical protein [Micromonospora zamorensis]|uniref:hypothetical protein n=1 Tax=Micromonospora zamorensis TaxID=709883 RepID=UPI002ED2E82F|nr:hypothetical protein OG886_16955 [Micromonospora zamorensis]